MANVNGEIASLLIGMDAADQKSIDMKMISLDGTKNKSRLGANAMIAVSIAVCKASAMARSEATWQHLGSPERYLLPVPMMNILNGGVHANWQGPDFQEYMIVPYGAGSFREALRWGAETYHALKGSLKKEGYSTAVGDEGGFVVKVGSNEKPLELAIKAIEEAGYVPGRDIGLAIDPASSGFFSEGGYRLRTENVTLSSDEMIDQICIADLEIPFDIYRGRSGRGRLERMAKLERPHR